MATDELTNFERALVIVAHPDDAEFGAAGTVARWVEHGVEVNYVICTDGSSGLADPNIKLTDLVAIREAEQREAADVLGVKQIEFLRQPDGQLRPTDELRGQIVALIRKYRPDRIICQNAVRNYSNLYGNHPDHLAAGQLAIEAVYPYARNPYAYPDLLAAGLEPFSVREVLVSGTDSPDFVVDVTATVGSKLAALARHRSQQTPGEDFSERVLQRMAAMGEPHGMAYAESFRRLKST
ncbi:MAG TPA: PIG-L deacetylase family protein [Candidatus Saccharimonadales bacterium]|nr:PIG-L deacetylase family protein [Candidatus Saccharimonadales bacterium]